MGKFGPKIRLKPATPKFNSKLKLRMTPRHNEMMKHEPRGTKLGLKKRSPLQPRKNSRITFNG